MEPLNSMLIRIASANDASRIAEIHTESWRATYESALTREYLADIVPNERLNTWQERLESPRPNQRVFVAEFNGSIEGFVCIFIGENPRWGSYLDNLHVSADHQSVGVGRSLLYKAARQSFIESPCLGMCLLVNQDNIRAQGFYKKLGASNAEEGVWNAPDGSVVPTYWFKWSTLGSLSEH